MMKTQFRRLGLWSALLLAFNVGADVESDRYALAKRVMPDLAHAVEGLFAGYEATLEGALSEADCQAFGKLIWERASEGVPTDDRILYWARLAAAPINAVLQRNTRNGDPSELPFSIGSRKPRQGWAILEGWPLPTARFRIRPFFAGPQY